MPRFVTLAIAVVIGAAFTAIANAASYLVADYFGVGDTTCAGNVRFRTHALLDTCLFSSILSVGHGRKIDAATDATDATETTTATKAAAAADNLQNYMKSKFHPSNLVPFSKLRAPQDQAQAQAANNVNPSKTLSAVNGTTQKWTYAIDQGSITVTAEYYDAADLAALTCSGTSTDSDQFTAPIDTCIKTSDYGSGESFGRMIIRQIASDISFPSNSGVSVSWFNFNAAGLASCRNYDASGVWGSYWFRTGICSPYSSLRDIDDDVYSDDDTGGGTYSTFTCDTASGNATLDYYTDDACGTLDTTEVYQLGNYQCSKVPLNGKDDDEVDMVVPLEDSFDNYGWSRIDCSSSSSLEWAVTSVPTSKASAPVTFSGNLTLSTSNDACNRGSLYVNGIKSIIDSAMSDVVVTIDSCVASRRMLDDLGSESTAALAEDAKLAIAQQVMTYTVTGSIQVPTTVDNAKTSITSLLTTTSLTNALGFIVQSAGIVDSSWQITIPTSSPVSTTGKPKVKAKKGGVKTKPAKNQKVGQNGKVKFVKNGKVDA